MRLCSRPAAPYPVRTGAGAGPALSPALSAATTARQPLAPAASLTAAEDVEAVADRRTILVTTAAADCPVGGDIDGGDKWRVILDLGLAGHVADGRDAPVEGQGAGKEALRGVHASGCHAGEMVARDMLMMPEPSV